MRKERGMYTGEVSGDEDEGGVDHGERRADIPPEVVGALRVVDAEVEIRQLGHPHDPLWRAGYLHYRPLVTGGVRRRGRGGDEG